MLVIKNLIAGTENQEILKGVNLTIKEGEIHAIMGPNGAGKTTLAMALMGHPGYKIKSRKSTVKIKQKEITNAKPEERARHGLFVAFQQPIEVTGVSVLAFLRTAYKALHPKDTLSLAEFKKKVADALSKVHLEETFMQRYLNEGFSGGEKKRAEVAQLMVLKPKFAILDEIDSGLDIDSLRFVAEALKDTARKNNMGILLITHYQRILHHLRPDYVHILMDGRIVASDGIALVTRIEEKGYADFTN
jgi:Fe-S cluster assembly ATP-binding protein